MFAYPEPLELLVSEVEHCEHSDRLGDVAPVAPSSVDPLQMKPQQFT